LPLLRSVVSVRAVGAGGIALALGEGPGKARHRVAAVCGRHVPCFAAVAEVSRYGAGVLARRAGLTRRAGLLPGESAWRTRELVVPSPRCVAGPFALAVVLREVALLALQASGVPAAHTRNGVAVCPVVARIIVWAFEERHKSHLEVLAVAVPDSALVARCGVERALAVAVLTRVAVEAVDASEVPDSPRCTQPTTTQSVVA
jgi:hypothetical protein